MTSRARFERFCRRHEFQIGRMREVGRDNTRWGSYTDKATQRAWLAWEASRRSHHNGP